MKNIIVNDVSTPVFFVKAPSPFSITIIMKIGRIKIQKMIL